MEKNKISVIVPIYNAERYVAKSIESLIEQTLKEIENNTYTQKCKKSTKKVSKTEKKKL